MRTGKHFDAFGHPTLCLSAMLSYYSNDPGSTRVLKSTLPCKYIVLPFVTIRIHNSELPYIDVYLVYPDGQELKHYDLNTRSIAALRKTYCGRGGWKGKKTPSGMIEITRAGRVVPVPYPKYL